MKTDSDLAALFAAFAHPSRIAILRALLSKATTGLSFGQLAQQLAIAPSTLTHHLREMENAGVLIRREVGRTTMLHLDLTALTRVVADLTALCCAPGRVASDKNQEEVR